MGTHGPESERTKAKCKMDEELWRKRISSLRGKSVRHSRRERGNDDECNKALTRWYGKRGKTIPGMSEKIGER